ncbi:17372_t:CDS:2 [Rhizophagus irregularis]|nr:17372_t:CDS:2 [Rhizophagus irregularis]
MSTKKEVRRDVAQNITLEEVHLIIKRCSDEIRLRGLREVDIFKPLNIGDSMDEVRKLLKYLLKDSRTEYEDIIRSYNIHAVVSAMKWALRRSDTVLVPYQYYEEFHHKNAEWDYDPSKGSFKKFLDYLPKQNRDILCELFDICADVTAESHINKMSAERIVKTIALCILGNKDRGYSNFDTAYDDWTKYSAACHHLFLAYLREKSVSTELNPRLTKLLDNYVEYRKTVTSAFFQFPDSNSDSKKQNRPLTRQVPTTNSNSNNRQTKTLTTFLPDVMDSMKRKTIIRPSTMMTADEKKSAEDMWDEFQTNGVTAMSDDFLKLFFSLEDRAKNVKISDTVSEKQWTQFSRKGFKSIYLDPLPDKLDDIIETSESGITSEGNNSSLSDSTSKEKSSNQEISLSRNDSGVSGVTLRQTMVWDDFSKKGFRNSVDNVSNSLTLTSADSIRNSIRDDENSKNNSSLQSEVEEKERSMSQVISLIKKKSISGSRKIVKFSSLRKPRRARSFESTQSSPDFSNDKEEDWEDWDIIDRAQDLPITTHLAIETVDEIFPYVWMETTAAADGDKWGDWVFIEPKKGLINECEWVMIEEESQVFSEWDVATTKTITRRRKMSAFSTFSIPWVRGNSKSRPVSKVTSRMSRVSKYSMASSVMPTLPAVWAMFDRSRPDDNSVPTNYKFKNKPKDPKSFAYQAAQVRASIMQTGFDDGAEATLQYEEQYVEGEYEYDDADYDYETDPTGENGYYGYSSDPGYYGHYNEYDEYQEEEEYYGDEYYDQDYNEQDYNDQQYNEQQYNGYNEDDYYYQDQGEGYSEYSGYEYAEEVEEVVEEQYTIPTPGSFVAQRQMVLQGELPALKSLPKRTFQGLSHESKYNNSKLFPMQSSERLTYQRPSISPKVTQIKA